MSLLQTDQLLAFYGDFQALYGITLTVEEGETVALIGANGAGKSTFLRAITGLVLHGGGEVKFKGAMIGRLRAEQILARGISLVPEGRKLFPSLSVEENLLMGGYAKRQGPWNITSIYELFPALRDHAKRPSMALSGGQQQMVAIGRALMANPELLLCDELSLGLAPVVIRDIYAALPRIKAEGTSVLLVEQDTGQALRVADRVYCFQEGKISLQGRPAELTREQISFAYFGV
ncbi:ABC transporter ATP-binding protein [Acidocella sp.]|uniref:ABC transporter ATP-binding protein n=1 Tax=Acidocella sp. TaxID=50710 RepID=UPI003D014798